MEDVDLQSSLSVQSFDESKESNNELLEKPKYFELEKVIEIKEESDDIKIEVIYSVCLVLNDSGKNCNTRLRIIGRSTSNLISHLTNTHATLSISSASEARKDARRLKEIQLTDNEWDLMRDIVNILGHFFEVTELLGSSEYVTFSYMITSILGLMDKLDCSIDYLDESNNINFEMPDLVFDNNVEFVDSQEEEESGPKGRKIKINTPIDDFSDEELFLAYLLDLRFKKLRFATSTQQLQVKAALREKYNNIKSLQSSLTLTNQPLDFNEQLLAENNQRECQIYQKTFIKSLFMQNTVDEPIDEISHYLSLPEISYNHNPFHWWNTQKTSLPLLSELARQYLVIPATSTLSERLFSDANNIITVRRMMLKPKLFERMLFLK
ncbi:335_t:CDS:2 [Scutellospora calospora]|uniref:335_t:CDS:1 n=1 Tax=Scutellospora calospora TaxID=85575 RepID=A0ACA9K3L0_9GLOM|nr:335_t:CDS:2 [Scutellospora calospora]